MESSGRGQAVYMAPQRGQCETSPKSLQPVLPEVDNDLPLEMETSRQNANRSSKNTLRLKTGAWRDSDTVFTTR